MKRIISLLLSAVFICTALSACKKSESGNANASSGDRELYNYDMAEYVTLGEYKGIEIDKSSETFQNYKESFFQNDVSQGDLYTKRTSGPVKKGDLTNFDYNGKRKSDGMAIDSNTTDLVMGSGQFIPGFEDNIIGKNIGDLFEFDITFPEDYGDEDLNGKVATFTIKINYVKDMPERNDEFAKLLGFASVADYEADLDKQVAKELIAVDLLSGDKCPIKSYPEAEKKRYDDIYDYYVDYANQQVAAYKEKGQTIDVDTVLYSALGKTSAGLKELYESTIKREIVTYAIFDKENLSYTEAQYNQFVENAAAAQGVTVDEYKQNADAAYIESSVICDVVFDYLYTQANVK